MFHAKNKVYFGKSCFLGPSKIGQENRKELKHQVEVRRGTCFSLLKIQEGQQGTEETVRDGRGPGEAAWPRQERPAEAGRQAGGAEGEGGPPAAPVGVAAQPVGHGQPGPPRATPGAGALHGSAAAARHGPPGPRSPVLLPLAAEDAGPGAGTGRAVARAGAAGARQGLVPRRAEGGTAAAAAPGGPGREFSNRFTCRVSQSPVSPDSKGEHLFAESDSGNVLPTPTQRSECLPRAGQERKARDAEPAAASGGTKAAQRSQPAPGGEGSARLSPGPERPYPCVNPPHCPSLEEG